MAQEWATVDEAIRSLEVSLRMQHARHYVYEDETRRPFYAKVRFDKPDGTKEFRVLARKPEGHWVATSAHLAHTPLFRLPEIGDHPFDEWILVVEGEKAAESAERIGLVATTSGGSGSTGKADWSPLKGRRVAVLPDNDEPGRKYAKEAAQAAIAAGAVDVRVVDLALPNKGDDLFEWVGARQNYGADKLKAQLLALIDNARPADPKRAPGDWNAIDIDALTTRPPVDWLVYKWVPSRAVTMIGGHPGSGKSFVALDLAMRVSHGMAHWFGEQIDKPGAVVYIATEGEGGYAQRIRAWKAHHAEERRRHPFKFVEAATGDGPVLSEAQNQATMRNLEQIAAEAGEPLQLIVVDTLTLAIEGDENASEDVRPALALAQRIASTFGCAVILVHHLRKPGPMDRKREPSMADLRGSGALAGNVDQILGLTASENGKPCGLSLLKAKDGAPGLSMQFVLDVVPTGMVSKAGREETSCVPRRVEATLASAFDAIREKAAAEAADLDAIVEAARRLERWASKADLVTKARLGQTKKVLVEDLARAGRLVSRPFIKGTGTQYAHPDFAATEVEPGPTPEAGPTPSAPVAGPTPLENDVPKKRNRRSRVGSDSPRTPTQAGPTPRPDVGGESRTYPGPTPDLPLEQPKEASA